MFIRVPPRPRALPKAQEANYSGGRDASSIADIHFSIMGKEAARAGITDAGKRQCAASEQVICPMPQAPVLYRSSPAKYSRTFNAPSYSAEGERISRAVHAKSVSRRSGAGSPAPGGSAAAGV